jgi:hypothetical protein
MWPDGGKKIIEPFSRGTMVVPPSWWWHGHAVVSEQPGQYIALKLSSKRNKIHRLSHGTMKSTRNGGNMLRFEDYPPGLLAEMKQIFAEACAKHGTKPKMQWALQDNT